MRINEVLIYEERLNIKPIISTSIKTLDKVFKSNNHEMRIVGGAVRDIALGKSPKDIDFATDATPDEMIAILDKANIKHKPTGIEHGTITAIIGKEPFEITTLRADTETDGRHAEVEFVTNWEEDAKRRDLTYNAMSMDIDGNVYDYFNGMDDLQDKVSKFVGDAEKRITEDYLRILRYFRFQGRLSTPTWDGDTLEAIKTHAKGLSGISAERIWQEMSKVLSGQNVASVVAMIEKAGVSKVIGLSTNNINSVKDKSNPIVALAQLGNSVDLAKRWKLSNNDAVLLDFLVKNKNNKLDKSKVEHMIADGVDKEKIQALATLQGQSKMADHASTAQVPNFPVTGADLIATGMKPGPEMGAKLNQLKQQWKQSNFTATKDELLEGWFSGAIKGAKWVSDKVGKWVDDIDDYYNRPVPSPNMSKTERLNNLPSKTNDGKSIKFSKHLIKQQKQDQKRLRNNIKEDSDFVTLKKDDKIVRVPRSRLEFYLGQHYEIVKEKINEKEAGEPIVYVDMDGVLANFFEEWAKLAGIKSGNYKDIPPADIDPTLDKMIGTDFFAQLPKFPTADKLIQMVINFFGSYKILSSPLRNDHANSKMHKIDWIGRKLKIKPTDIIIVGDKTSYAKQADGTPNILIDDLGKNIQRWQSSGGLGIKYQADEDSLSKVQQGLENFKRGELAQEDINEADDKERETLFYKLFGMSKKEYDDAIRRQAAEEKRKDETKY